VLKDGVASMRALTEIEIPAGETVTLQRGGKHVMLMRPTGPTDNVSLQFFHDDELILTVDTTVDTHDNSSPGN